MGKITKANTAKVIELLSEGYSLVKACEGAGISRAGAYKRMRADEEFRAAVYTARAESAEKALEELDGMYLNALEGRKRYDPNILRDYAQHVRWRAKTSMPEQYGESKNRAGVEVSDGTATTILRVDHDTEIDGTEPPEAPFTCIGIGCQYDYESPYFDNFQILPRKLDDLFTNPTPTEESSWGHIKNLYR